MGLGRHHAALRGLLVGLCGAWIDLTGPFIISLEGLCQEFLVLALEALVLFGLARPCSEDLFCTRRALCRPTMALHRF